jgi:5-methylcytosine-specific restriction protein B
MERYRELERERRIAFVTFHQSMDYESFVEGLRPETEESEARTEESRASGSGFRLEPRPGIFREICSLADQARKGAGRSVGAGVGIDLEGRQFWKMGLGAIGTEDFVYEGAIAGDYIVLGWGGDMDWIDPRFESAAEVEREWKSKPRSNDSPSNYTQLWPFRARMKKGDIVVVPYGNAAFRAVAEVTGDYEFVPGQDGEFNHRRKVRWLLKLTDPLPLDTIVQGKFTMRTLYQITENRLNKPALRRLLVGEEAKPGDGPDQFVLIIDEINRANVSKVFGELITLIEPDKRLGRPNALEVLLPYSRTAFGVPENLHIIGTMNTADRSIALLDTALRRRFRFIEVTPSPEALNDAAARTQVPLAEVLAVLNDRIEFLVDRDHRIGHAFFVDCQTREEVDRAFHDKVIPLLQEYFFEDWSRVAVALGERADPPGPAYKGAFLECRRLKDPSGEGAPDRLSWSVRSEFATDAYERLVKGSRPSLLDEALSEPEPA